MIRPPCRALATAAALALAPGALCAGQTWVVDDDGGPGVHFTDIPPAIAAAQSGDTLIVQDGQYSSFVLDKGLSLIGHGAAAIASGKVEVRDLLPGEVAAIDRMALKNVLVEDCDGTVLFRDCTGKRLDVLSSADLRVHRTDYNAAVGAKAGSHGGALQGSRAELVGARFFGAKGKKVEPDCDTVPGGSGLFVDLSARVHAVQVECVGGYGGNSSCSGTAPPAGHGASVSASELIVVDGDYTGGNGGAGPTAGGGFGCINNGEPGIGIEGCAGPTLVRHSGAALFGGWSDNNTFCQGYYACAIDLCGNTEVVPAEPDPQLILIGSTAAGDTVQFRVAGPPGASVLLYLGRKPVVVPDPQTEIELLTPMSVQWPLGVLPTGGSTTKTYKIRPLQPGYTFYAQAELTLTSGEIRRTNSVPIIVR